MKRFSKRWAVGAVFAGMCLAAVSVPAVANDLSNAPDDLGVEAEEILRQEGISLDDASLGAVVTDQGRDAEVRYWAAVLLGQQGGEGAAEALAEALGSPEVDVRLGAVQGFGELGGEDAVRGLEAALEDSEAAVRSAAVLALGRGGGPKAAPLLAAKLRDRDELSHDVRMQAAIQLGRLADGAAIPALVGSLGDPQATVRAASAVSLASFGDERALPTLVAVALDPLSEEWIRVDAIRALEELSGETFRYTKPYFAPTTDQERQAALQHIRQWWRDHQRSAGAED